MNSFTVTCTDNKYEFLSLGEALSFPDCRHAAHCCIFSQNSFHTVGYYQSKAYISMQMRFDGYLGFPGGIIDKVIKTNSQGIEDIVDGLNRELVEEMNLDKRFFVTAENHLGAYYLRETNRCYHLFDKEVSVDDFVSIERNALDAEDYGKEVLGLIRIPLCTMKEGKGLPAFLSNNFAGCCKQQLCDFLVHRKLVTQEELKGFL